ncbi:acetyltransferase [Novosphingobium beihaiensis]|uniref:Acetyltransferase n=1 Tax=Novosphingobium beihaiensis TaxID=2930389 RepID=A0ABT0BPX2_9SPHN|nr:acetyltransferase [Novosphingobium beihaiensis]MCJ2187089.1 acetyltransferase [Novosphingobium beihaiensis]
MTVRPGTAQDAPRAFAIWKAAVEATHGFLSEADRIEIAAMVEGMLPQAPLWIAQDEAGEAQGFMIFADGMIEALFVDPAAHGRGHGSALVAHALTLAPAVRVDANEQADNALPFYEAKGFERIGRSDHDDCGRPYSIVHLRYRAAP